MMLFGSDHFSVEDTALDAANGKWSSTRAGYYEDKYISSFLDLKRRLLPHQNLGYFIRNSFFRKVLHNFFSVYGFESQVVVLGCGYDTLFWLLNDENIKFKHWFDLDKENVINFKKKIISSDLFQPLENYHVECIDFNNTNLDFVSILSEFEQLPTVFIDEFSLIYCEYETTQNIIKLIASNKDWHLASYGMVQPEDEFGQLVQESFIKLKIPLKSYKFTASVQETDNVYIKAGFNSVRSLDSELMLKLFFTKTERDRFLSLEYFDDPKELFYLLRHYCAIVAGNDQFVSILPEI
ncbi:Leucine carboxyl methyltransferase family protein [Tritrichomonas foetus]|uniref:Leucine carboxyl methyltransferase 1 n=1 Tax=Tritrichomonas foetus TaxID=1144522 RepID=A0A1J4KFT4_9EUKA|nr:Leucine carboxyl methyltransferase family protein [Tritrichomonas foetus]|eukprot:OHT08636.1 Leucine carboxyl methyltransferase family protein [Tritrichomonas foetus]